MISRRKKNVYALTISIAVILGFGIWVFPPFISLYHQIEGGHLLIQALDPSDDLDTNSILCFDKPLTDEIQSSIVDQAVADLQIAKAYNPRLSQTYFLLGRTYCLIGEPQRAVDYFTIYTQLRPSNPLGHLQLGIAYAAIGSKGETEFRKQVESLKSVGVSGEQIYGLYRNAYQNKRYTEAIQWLRHAVHLMGDGIDTFEDGHDDLLPLDSFITTQAWIACPRCDNGSG